MLKIPLIQAHKILKLDRNQGHLLLTNPLLNKGTAFTEKERIDFNLTGYLPEQIEDLKVQCKTAYYLINILSTNLEKFMFLRRLQDTNETLFYALLEAHMEELLPLIYTPVIATASEQFSYIYQQPRGLFLSYPLRNKITEILSNEQYDHTKLIVITDGEHILSIGDQGIGGMAIAIGKLSLYSLCAGIHPQLTLPIVIDTGTNNTKLINDPLYKGWRHERIHGDAYHDFVDQIITAIQKRFPNVILHMEDFAQHNAYELLQRYRNKMCLTNGDIQGTGAIALSATLAALHKTNQNLQDQRIVIVGTGSVGSEIGELLVSCICQSGIADKDAREKIYLVDPTRGLIHDQMQDLHSYQKKLAQSLKRISTLQHDNQVITLHDVVKHAHPTILIGNCGKAKIFDEGIVREMKKHVANPIIFPLSNPSSSSEAGAEDLLNWTDNTAIIATGTTSSPIIKDGKTYHIDQANNMYLFPGIGLGLLATQATSLTDGMIRAASHTLSDLSPAKDDSQNSLFPSLKNIKDISFTIALAVAEQGVKDGCVRNKNDLEKQIKSYMWTPKYLNYEVS